MFLAVPGRNPAWASPPSGEAGPGRAVLVATGLLAGAERGRLLCCSGRFMRRDILGGLLRLPFACLRGAGCPVTRYLRRPTDGASGFAHGEGCLRGGALEISFRGGVFGGLSHELVPVRH